MGDEKPLGNYVAQILVAITTRTAHDAVVSAWCWWWSRRWCWSRRQR